MGDETLGREVAGGTVVSHRLTEKMSAADAVYTLLAELTTRPEVVTLSSAHDAAPAAEILKDFCERHGLGDPSWS